MSIQWSLSFSSSSYLHLRALCTYPRSVPIGRYYVVDSGRDCCYRLVLAPHRRLRSSFRVESLRVDPVCDHDYCYCLYRASCTGECLYDRTLLQYNCIYLIKEFEQFFLFSYSQQPQRNETESSRRAYCNVFSLSSTLK